MPPEQMDTIIGRLTETDLAPTLFTCDDYPNKLIHLRPESADVNIEEVVRNGDSVLHRLSSQYGIRIPEYRRIIGPSPRSEHTIFTIRDRIEGTELLKTPRLKRKVSRIDQFLTSYVQSLIDTQRNGGYFLHDFGYHQLMFGHKVTETKAQDDVYLVDTDPRTHQYNTVNSIKNANFFIQIGVITEMINEMQMRLGQLLEAGNVMDTYLDSLELPIEYARLKTIIDLEHSNLKRIG